MNRGGWRPGAGRPRYPAEVLADIAQIVEDECSRVEDYPGKMIVDMPGRGPMSFTCLYSVRRFSISRACTLIAGRGGLEWRCDGGERIKITNPDLIRKRYYEARGSFRIRRQDIITTYQCSTSDAGPRNVAISTTTWTSRKARLVTKLPRK
jgi:hypothetical protein